MAAFSIFSSAVPLIVSAAAASSFAAPVMFVNVPFTVTFSASVGLMYRLAGFVSVACPFTVPLTCVAPTIHIEPLSFTLTPVPVMLPPVMTVVPSFMSTEPIAALSLM